MPDDELEEFERLEQRMIQTQNWMTMMRMPSQVEFLRALDYGDDRKRLPKVLRVHSKNS